MEKYNIFQKHADIILVNIIRVSNIHYQIMQKYGVRRKYFTQRICAIAQVR